MEPFQSVNERVQAVHQRMSRSLIQAPLHSEASLDCNLAITWTRSRFSPA